LWLVGVVTAGLTAFYTFRAIFITFHGQPRDHYLHDHAHESRLPITVALGVLAVLALLGGALGLPTFLGLPNALEKWLEPIYLTGEHAAAASPLPFGGELSLLLTSTGVALGGLVLAYLFYVVRPDLPRRLAVGLRPVFVVLVNKYYLDEIYAFLFVKPGLNLAEAMAKGVDNLLIDGVMVDGSARLVGWWGRLVSYLQSGYLRHYALATFIGVLVLVGYFFLK
jgi:NADH-quinone oxidoreductase subunit L